MSKAGVKNCTLKVGCFTHIPDFAPAPQATEVRATLPYTLTEVPSAVTIIGRVVEVETRTARAGVVKFI